MGAEATRNPAPRVFPQRPSRRWATNRGAVPGAAQGERAASALGRESDWSAPAGLHERGAVVEDDSDLAWFWNGSHAGYDTLRGDWQPAMDPVRSPV